MELKNQPNQHPWGGTKTTVGPSGNSKQEVIQKIKSKLGKDTKTFNNFKNKSKPTDKNAGDCKNVAKKHENPHTGYIVYRKDNKFTTLAHDFNVANGKAIDYINHKSANNYKSFKDYEIVAYIGKPLNYRYRKNNKKDSNGKNINRKSNK